TRETGIPYMLELETVRKDGSNGWMWVQGEAEVDSTGKTIEIWGAAQDITTRKKLEIDLKTKTEFLENITENMFDLVSLTDLEGNFLFVGKSHEILGYDPSVLMGKNVFVLVHPEDFSYIMNEFTDFLEDKRTRKVQYRCMCADGTYLWVETLGKILTDENGNPERIIFSTRDITEQRHKENILQKAMKEKEFLMRELNHRVKNNFNMVSSLISLKEGETDYDLSDLKHRIDVIKLVHEKLHQQNDIEHIALKEYFQELLESIFYSTSRWTVQIINNIEDVSIPQKAAIPLGLVVNEIATNAVKYGFTNNEEARFSVDMMKDSDGKHYSLTLSNTGNPFPEEIGLENPETMGLQLVSSLVAQLNGTIELQKKPNPVFTIRFPIREE
ncbi:MAG: sensor histidine kinase, partial [Spirochaetia bacterium]